MPATMRIDQAGLSAGVNGRARLDGKIDGSLVTLTSVTPGSTNSFRLKYVPPGATGARASLAPTGGGNTPVWTFTPDAGVHGPYLVELIVNEGQVTESRQEKVFGVPSPRHGFVFPALGEKGDPSAATDLTGAALAAVLAAASRNVDEDGAPSAEGWQQALRAMGEAIDIGNFSVVESQPGERVLVRTGQQLLYKGMLRGDFITRGSGMLREVAGAGGGGGGGGSVRDPQFLVGSNDDGTFDEPLPLNLVDFTAVINRTNYWVTDLNCTLPAVGAGDHNKVVVFREAALLGPGSGSGILTVTPSGGTTISRGNQTGLSSIRIQGAGALHAFRYDEGNDKWLLIAGAGTLSGRELRHQIEDWKVNVDNVAIELPINGVNNDTDLVVPLEFGRARYVFITLDGNLFPILSGLPFADRDEPDFCYRKRFLVTEGILIIDSSAGAPSSGASIIGVGSSSRFVFKAGDWFDAVYLRGVDSWVVIEQSGPDFGTYAPINTAEARDLYPGEILRVRLSADLNLNMPGSDFRVPGQRQGIVRLDEGGSVCTVSGNGADIQDPISLQFGASALVPLSSDASWTWDEFNGRWQLFPKVPTPDAAAYAHGASFYPRLVVPQTPVADLLLDADRLYLLYMGYFAEPKFIDTVLFYMTVKGVGSQDAQIGLFNALGPNDTDVTFQRVDSQNIAADLTLVGNQGPLRETVAWNLQGHCYLGIRCNMGTTQPKFATVRDILQIGEHSTVPTAGDLAAFTTALGDRFGSNACPYFVAVGG